MITAGVVLRPRSPTECVDLGIALLRADPGAHARAWAWVAIPIGFLSIGAWWVNEWFGLATAVLLARLVQAPTVVIAGGRVTGAPTRLGRGGVAEVTGRLLGGLLGPAFVALVAQLVPVLGWFVWARQLFVPEVVLLERAKAQRAARVAQLAEQGGFRVWSARMWLLGIEVAGAFAGEAIGQGVTDELLQLGTPWGTVWDGAITPWVILGILAVQPLVAAVRLAFYLDVRTRSESLDVFFALWMLAGRPA